MLFKKKHEYKVTKRIAYQYIKYSALVQLGQRYVEENNDEKARECFIDAEKARILFWQSVNNLYRDTKGVNCSYDRLSEIVKIEE